MVKRIVLGINNRVKLYYTAFSSIIPKLIFGNTVGFKYNLAAKSELAKFRKSFSVPTDFKESIVSNSDGLTKYGYITLPKVLDAVSAKTVKEKYDAMIEDPKCSVSSPNGFTRFLYDPIKQIPEVVELLCPEIFDTIQSYYKTAFRIESVRAWRNYHVPGYDPDRMDAFSNTFHNDYLPVTGLRVFILLSDDVTRETGATRFHDKIRSKEIIRSMKYFHRFKLSQDSIRQLNDPNKLIYFEGSIGDVCICNTQECLHAASIPKKGTLRDILQFEVYPAEGNFDNKEEIFKQVPADTEVTVLMK